MGRRSTRTPLGRSYQKLWAAAATSALGDGMRIAALPLLAASLTRDPGKVALVTLAGRIPWLLFPLISGAVVDRVDRRRLMAIVDFTRMAVLAGVAATVLGDVINLGVLYAAAFALGTGETLFDNAAHALMPGVVGRDRLEAANSRLFGAQLASAEFIGPPIGSALFAVAAAVPFFIDSASFAIGAALVLTIAPVASSRQSMAGATMRRDIADGLRWVWRHHFIRNLAVILGIWNLMTTAQESILVLYALEVLHMGKAGFGLLFSAGAVGGVAGTVFASRISRALGPGWALRSAMLLWSVGAATLAVTHAPVVAGVAFAAAAFSGLVWNVITVSLRQSMIPRELLGRVNSVYRFVSWGMMPFGAVLGGVLARSINLQAPFAVGAVTTLVMLVFARRTLDNQRIRSLRS